MKQKHLDYLAPEAEILVVRFEGNLLTVSGGDPGKAGKNLTQGNSWTFDDED